MYVGYVLDKKYCENALKKIKDYQLGINKPKEMNNFNETNKEISFDYTTRIAGLKDRPGILTVTARCNLKKDELGNLEIRIIGGNDSVIENLFFKMICEDLK